ncbi:DUF3696 domain-containing protein [Parabacteroides sp. OttesenSCG-928-J18]|nr:DUF3696 domain-containing protein [Parabacteroides sp. OttesenSCG-928-O15]MDL2244454.1 DUF3696 domain-containing protein [Parabacteroides sp. OttesenSCG-928-J18]
MITRLALENFKSFCEETTFDLNKVTIFTGYNGRGKSTVLQSLLLLSQSVISKGSFEKLHLNGDWINLGDFDEIWNTEAKKSNVKIGFNTNILTAKEVILEYDISKDDKVAELSKATIDGENLFSSAGAFSSTEETEKESLTIQSPPTSLLNQFKDFHFISANRCGPTKYVDKLEVPEYHRVGKNGDLTINTLASYKETINSTMKVSEEEIDFNSLGDAVSCWISYIMDGGDLMIKGDEKESSVLSVNFTNPTSGKAHKAQNVGFGYSYILSIVVTALIAKQGSLVLIENPEAHLHPKAQARMTHLLSKLAGRGVQVLIETHSDHILNGFRLCALKEEFSISYKDLAIYFFDIDYSSKKLEMQSNGRINNWPDGFFDQQERDLAEIMRLGISNR